MRRNYLFILLFVFFSQSMVCMAAGGKTFRILHVMSFDSPFRWTDGQFAGFKEGLGRDVKVEYKVFQMNVKKYSSPQAKAEKGAEARAIIESWKPDLVYGSDDDAQDQVARHYANSKIPFVFSGVNKTPESHGLKGASNVAGVLEEEHFIESVKILRRIAPNVKRLAVITDTASHWVPVVERIQTKVKLIPGINLVSVDVVNTYEEYQQRILAYPAKVDAVVQLGIFALQGKDGNNVPYQEVQKWTSLNCTLPDISFWIDRVHFGVLAAMTVSEHRQGIAAGKLARAILLEGKSPDSLPIQPTTIGRPAVNLARAKSLGLKVDSTLLLSAEVAKHYQWDSK